MNVLIVEDSRALRNALKTGLTKVGYAVDATGDGTEGWTYARTREYDVMVLDLMLPGLDGLEVLRRVRRAGRAVRVLILSAKDQVEDRVRGLQAGADDYMIKPFAFDELCARIATLVRRKYDAANPVVNLRGLRLNTALRVAAGPKGEVRLTPGEYAILEALVFHRGRVVTLEQLMDAIHDSDAAPGPNLVQVLVCTLRKHLSEGGVENLVRTRRGTGYYVE